MAAGLVAALHLGKPPAARAARAGGHATGARSFSNKSLPGLTLCSPAAWLRRIAGRRLAMGWLPCLGYCIGMLLAWQLRLFDVERLEREPGNDFSC